MKKTLLLTASGPGLDVVGGVLIRDMLETDGVENLSLVSLIPEEKSKMMDATHLESIRNFAPPSEFSSIPTTGYRSTIRKFYNRRTKYDTAIATIANDVGSCIRDYQPEQVWAILNGTAVIDVLHHLVDTLTCDLLLQIWDDPLHLALQRRLDFFSRKRTVGRFHTLMRHAKRTAVISEEMAVAYQNLSKGPCIIIRHGVGVIATPKSEPSSSNEFRIGIAGSMYAPSAWRALQQALDQINWRLNDRQVVLIAVGGKFEFVSRAKAECRFYGWRQQTEVMALMADCDLLYLPQAFESSERPLTTLSFPTKLSTYAATGRPIFIHTPEYGSLSRFIRENKIGVAMHSLQPNELVNALKRYEDHAFRSEQAKASAYIGNELLTQKAFRQGVSRLLGIEPIPSKNGQGIS